MTKLPFLSDLVVKLARWANTLNGWHWPADMPFKPKDWDALPILLKIGDAPNAMPDYSRRSKYTVTKPFTRALERLVGKKEILRWHHLNNLGRTEVEFERWWEQHKDDDLIKRTWR